MNKLFLVSAVAVSGLASFSASATDIMARVISSTPVVQQVAVPRQVCSNQAVVSEAPRSGAGALLGAVAGGAAGNAIGNGGGRAVATILGVVGGAMLGNNIEGSNSQVQNVQQCSTQTYYENRATYYNVVYEYQGTQYNVQMQNDPGQYVRLQVTPVGTMNQAPQQQPQTYAPPVQPLTYYQQPAPQAYVQPAYVQPVYVQPAAYVQAPAYYSRPYIAPIGLSLNLGYSRGYGHRHGHWR
ncbi:MAG: 17 kDa surface antigen [Polaromonas sp.]|jgi:uncharacterized protein YcfJ|nr:17 kDa surface antigen [Polaromonas sp.]